MTARAAAAPEGLTAAEAARRLAVDGPNELEASRRRGVLASIREVAGEPMFLLLFGAAALYLVLGDVREAAVLIGSVLVLVAITVIQEGRTERALAALRGLTSPRAQVMRDGVVTTVAARELVCGDVVRVAEGDRVAADVSLCSATVLSVDESVLTGESVPVPRSSGERIAAGALILSGRGVGEVVATGARTTLGRIGEVVREEPTRPTPLQGEVARLVRRVAILAGSLSLLVAAILAVTGTRVVVALLGGITVAMALLPEEFPVVLIVFLALGAWRIARQRVLTRRLAAVEALGAVDVLCTDKTGTLTENRMAVRRLVSPRGGVVVEGGGPLPEDVHELVEHAILACPPDPFDPMEKAFVALGAQGRVDGAHLHPAWVLVREYPLAPELLAVTYAWRPDEGRRLVVATKGAPEAIFELCHLDDEAAAPWRRAVEEMAEAGLRVLGVARARATSEGPDHPHDVLFELLGLIGLEDPVRAGVPEALAACARAGIRVVLVTGDHPATARAVARRVGLPDEGLLLGGEIEALDDAALAARLAHTAVVARAVPAHKLRIVHALRRLERVTAMTGDGVNDVPALKAADVAIAMGARGTDVAREAAALVLADDDFTAIAGAIRAGRRIFDNLGNAFGYVVAVHLPIAGLALVPALLGWGAMLTPVLVVLLELVIDPACSVVFELDPADEDLMRRPPRGRHARLLDRRRVAWSVTHGVLALAVVLAVLAWARGRGLDRAHQGSCALAALIAGNLALVLASRSVHAPWWRTIRRWNPGVAILGALVLSALAVILLVPAVAHALGLAALAPAWLLVLAGIGAAPLLLVDAAKCLEPTQPVRAHAAPAQAVRDSVPSGPRGGGPGLARE